MFGLYFHWPYCLSKCPYCDFASCVTRFIDEEALYRGYVRDMDTFSVSESISSIFFGGGTPSLMSLTLCEKLLNVAAKRFHLGPDIEISLEANPDAITFDKMKAFRQLGINRLSIGVQSLTDQGLHQLGRRHSVQTATQRIFEAASVFDNLNIDLIYARPHQKKSDWEKELTTALSFNLPHYSLYQLTIEEGTVFGKQHLKTVSETQARALYQLTDDIMNAAGKPAYEVSNYARPGYECRHNLTYWLGDNYLGFGPAAHGRFGLIATENKRSVNAWLQTPMEQTTLTPAERDLEKLMMHLRLRRIPTPVQKLNPQSIRQAQRQGWITLDKDGFLPTQQGILMLNSLTLLLAD